MLFLFISMSGWQCQYNYCKLINGQKEEEEEEEIKVEYILSIIMFSLRGNFILKIGVYYGFMKNNADS